LGIIFTLDITDCDFKIYESDINVGTINGLLL
jgi:hypothetical protein